MIFGIGHIDGAVTIGHGMSGIAHVAVRRVRRICLWSIKGKFSMVAEIESASLSFAGRPGIEMHPVVAPCLEELGFFERQCAFVLEPIGKPGRFDFLAKIEGGIAAKGDCTKRIAAAAAPSAMIPRACNEIVQMFGVGFFEARVRGHWAVKIFLVPPTSDVEIRNGGLLKAVSDGVLSPEFVVARMSDKLVPGR